MYFAFGIVPVKVYTNVSVASLIGGEGVVRFNYILEVYCMLLTDVLDPKVVHHKGEPNGLPIMPLKAWDYFALFVTMFVEPFLEQGVGNET